MLWEGEIMEEIKILAEAILEQQKHGQLCPETIKKLEELVK